MTALLNALLWVGGPALLLGAFVVVPQGIGVGQRWARRRWQRRIPPVSPTEP